MSKLLYALGAGIALLLAAGPSLAAGEAGTVKVIKGSVLVERAGKRVPMTVGDRVMSGDRVITGADGAVGIVLRDNTRLSAGPDSVLSLDKYSFDSTTHAGEIDASVRKGTLSVISGKVAAASPDKVSFRTPTATLGVRGTEFVIEVADRGAGL
jgi:hypothetical protein